MTPIAGKRTLPHRPHLEHLRKQAKARLVEMRGHQPDARLADAQRALAQDYGFPSWGLLRAEVFRQTGVSADHQLPQRRRRKGLAAGYRDHDIRDAQAEQALPSDRQLAFFVTAAGTNVGILFILVAIMMALWIFTAALPG